MTVSEWNKYEGERQRAISDNRSRRMLKNPLPPLPVPPKLEAPQGYAVETKDGNYVGFWPIDDLGQVRELVAEYHDPDDCVFTREKRLR